MEARSFERRNSMDITDLIFLTIIGYVFYKSLMTEIRKIVKEELTKRSIT